MPTRLPLQNTRAIQVVVNAFLLAPGNFIVEQLSLRDVGIIWAYDFVWLIVLDLVKMGILNVQEGGVAPLEETQGRGGFGSLGGGVKRTANARAALSKLAKDVSRLAMGRDAGCGAGGARGRRDSGRAASRCIAPRSRRTSSPTVACATCQRGWQTGAGWLIASAGTIGSLSSSARRWRGESASAGAGWRAAWRPRQRACATSSVQLPSGSARAATARSSFGTGMPLSLTALHVSLACGPRIGASGGCWRVACSTAGWVGWSGVPSSLSARSG